VAYINKHKSELYFPLITKPSELVSKWANLKRWAKDNGVKIKEGKDQPNDLDYLKEETRKFNARRDEALKNKIR
jgi:hypothetical protein